MSYHHFSTFERGRIEELFALDYSMRAISRKLGRHHSSVAREIERNTLGGSYRGEDAQSLYHTRRKCSIPRGKHTHDLIGLVTEKLRATWFPEQIANTVTLGVISFKTIYNWIYQGRLPAIEVQSLRRKGKRRNAEKRGKFSMGTSIAERPRDIREYLWSLGA